MYLGPELKEIELRGVLFTFKIHSSNTTRI
jgi:hypothetical protein